MYPNVDDAGVSGKENDKDLFGEEAGK